MLFIQESKTFNHLLSTQKQREFRDRYGLIPNVKKPAEDFTDLLKMSSFVEELIQLDEGQPDHDRFKKMVMSLAKQAELSNE